MLIIVFKNVFIAFGQRSDHTKGGVKAKQIDPKFCEYAIEKAKHQPCS